MKTASLLAVENIATKVWVSFALPYPMSMHQMYGVATALGVRPIMVALEDDVITITVDDAK